MPYPIVQCSTHRSLLPFRLEEQRIVEEESR